MNTHSFFCVSLAALMTLLDDAPAADKPVPRRFDVIEYGAVGDGRTLDTAAIQRAIDAAASTGGRAQVRLRGGRRYLVGTLKLHGAIDFHLERSAELLISTNRADYNGDGVITADGVDGLRISGPGKIDGRAKEFMTGYDPAGEWWVPAEWRPKMFLLTACTNLEIRDLTFGNAPQWGLHLLGCRKVLVERVTIRNLMDVPNCDGIDPDHCQEVEIRDCHIRCGDDAIVVKTTRQTNDFGPSANIYVHDCVLETQDSGLKIGTETTQDIHDIRFERCVIRTCSRALTVQLRDEGNVFNLSFRDIKFRCRYYADPWWGRAEAISFTAIPRNSQTRLGTLHHVRVENVSGRSENSVRICGTPTSQVQDVFLDHVEVTLDRWTAYAGGLFDNRPTTVLPGIEAHGNPGFSLRWADNVTLRNCRVAWGRQCPQYYTYALEAEQVTGLKLTNFAGQSAHPERDDALWIHQKD